MPASSARTLTTLALACGFALLLGGCRYYEVTRSDGTRERISKSEYEDLQRSTRRLGTVPSTGLQQQLEVKK